MIENQQPVVNQQFPIDQQFSVDQRKAQVRAILNQILQHNPQIRNVIQQGVQEIGDDPDITPEVVEQLINILEQTLINPASYPQLRQMMLQLGVDELPEQFDPGVIGTFLMVFYTMTGVKFAKGGLAQAAEQLRARGRNGDTMLVHISPFEDSILRQYGGSGRINPVTRLPEYGFWKSIKKAFKAVAPIALSIVAPGLGTAIGSALGATGAWASALGGAIIGGGTAALTGGDALKGALFGGLGGGLSGTIGNYTNTQLGLGLGQTGANILGSTLTGAGIGAITGEGAAKGAMQGLAGGVLGNTVSGLAGTGTGAVAEGIRSAGQTMGNMTTLGYTPSQVLQGGALAGLVSGVKTAWDGTPTATGDKKAPLTEAQKQTLDQQLQEGTITRDTYAKQTGQTDAEIGPTGPMVSDAQADANLEALNAKYTQQTDGGMPKDVAAQSVGSQTTPGGLPVTAPAIPAGTPSTIALPSTGPAAIANPAGAGTTTPSTGLAGTDIGLNMKTLGAGMSLMSLIGAAQTPEQVQQAVAGSNMSEAQKEYFNRNTQYWDWNELQNRAKAQNVGLGEYLSKNWNTVADETMYKGSTSGEVTKCMGGRVKKMAVGGPLSRLARGGGSGRDDTIAARLSDGEYVIDAEAVALLGDGSIDEGARRLDAFRSNIRKQKGKALARGRISPNAKSPLAYLKGAM